MKKHYRHENDCANCGADLQGKFCHVCGQENLELRENFGHMMNHAISDYFHFDHQFFNTLKPLLLKPGKLTMEYMAGKRVSYLHPVKMYIFISLIYFLVLFQSGFKPVKVTQTDSKTDKKELIKSNKKLDSLSKDPNMPGFARSLVKNAKEKSDSAIKKADEEQDNAISHKKKKRNNINIIGWDRDEQSDKNDTTYSLYLASQSKLTVDKRDGFFKKYIRKREFELRNSGKDIQEILIEGVKHNTPKMMFLLLPLFALLLRLTFWKNKKFYVEHLIYSFHFHCFLFLFLTLIMLAQMALPTNWDTLRDLLYWFATLTIMWYIYRSLRVVYNRSRWRTISKMIGLSMSYTFVFSFCMVVLVIFVALFD